MKLCLGCKNEFDHESWDCPLCQWSPQIINGFPAFSPLLAQSNDGMPDSIHHQLDKLQEQSFWFRVRNGLIQDMVKKYFSDAADILEIGCGTGFVLNGIRDVLPSVKLTATEIYSNGLSYAAQRVSAPSQFLQVDARQLPYKEEFDLIAAFDVLEHIEEDSLVMGNMRDALRPQGGVIITVPQHPWLWSKSDELACHKRRYTEKQLTSLLHEHGFEILLSTSFMFFLLPVMLIQRFFADRREAYDQTNELALPSVIDKIFELILASERRAIQFGIKFPIGGSRLMVAKKHA